MLLETKNWWFWIDSRVLRSSWSFHNYEKFWPYYSLTKNSCQGWTTKFSWFCVSIDRPLNLIAIVSNFFIKKNWKRINDRFYIKMQMFLKNWRIRGFFWKGNLNFTLILKNINKTFYYFSYLFWTHWSVLIWTREGEEKRRGGNWIWDETVNGETRILSCRQASPKNMYQFSEQ